MDNVREEFEAWCEVNLLPIPLDRNGNKLYSIDIQSAWGAWQASRAALCVELPKEETTGRFDNDSETGYVNGYNSALSDVKEHLRFHGVSHK